MQIGTPGTPDRISSSKILTRSILFFAPPGNTANVYVASTEAFASSVNRITLEAGRSLEVRVDNYADLNAFYDLMDIWFDADNSSDRLVVMYNLDKTNPGDGTGAGG